MIPVLAVGFVACSKKEEAKAPTTPTAVAETPAKPGPAPVVVPKVPAVSTEERAAKLGFSRHLPQDTESVLSFYNGTKSAERVKSSKLWKLIEKQMGGGMVDLDDDNSEPKNEEAKKPDAPADEPVGPAMLFGTEFSIALGKSSGEQLGNLLTLNRRISYFQFRGMAKAFVAAAKNGDAKDIGNAFTSGYGEELATDLLKDPESGIALLEKAKVTPMYFAFRANESRRAEALQQLSGVIANLGMLGEMATSVDVEKAGQKFEGFKILGAKISANIAADRDKMDKTLGTATVDQLLAALAKKDIVILSGTIGDYALMFIGSSLDDLNFASDSGHSLVAGDALAFSDAYAKKELAALVYGQKAARDTLYASIGGLADMTNGLRDGLSGSDGLGDTRDLEAMLQIVAEREAALMKLVTNESSGTVAFFEEGLKIESYGGSDSGAIDWKSSNKLAHLGDSPDAVLFADLSVDAAYDEKANAYVESVIETAYAMAMKVAEFPMENKEMAQFKEIAKMFDSNFRTDAVDLWSAFNSDFGKSFGGERALVVDLKGSAPAVPGIPQAVVDQAKVPRISIIRPVADRAKLAASWDKMNAGTTRILAKVSAMVGQEIPMQKPLSSEKNRVTTWFFPLPFFNDDFLPSVTLNDQWFAASTSKNQALDLIAKATAGGETRDGFWLNLNFKALETFANENYKIADENAEALMGAPFTQAQRKNALDAIKSLDDLDRLTVHSRREGTELRTSIHFKTR